MSKTANLLFTGSLAAFMLFALAAGKVTVSSLDAFIPDENRNEIVVRWVVAEEDQLREYRIDRKLLVDDGFLSVGTIRPEQGEGFFPNKRYEFIDRNVFKTTASSEPVIYKLTAVYTDGTEFEVGQTSVNYTSTAVRRTWGSIKAMFQ